jgi:misacylated tRNA(Ala) deacylase
MTEPLFRRDPYLREAPGRVLDVTAEGALRLEDSLFYAQGGGQPGDSGWFDWAGGSVEIVNAVKGQEGGILLVPAEGAALPPAGTAGLQRLDWARRHAHMRVHTALHLLSVAIPLPVTGGQIGADKGRLDFLMPEPLGDVAAIEAAVNALIARDLPVTESWITDAELQANPGLVKTMSVMPPMGQGRVRLVRIGTPAEQIDLQPCGGTHVARTGEIGPVRIGKVENKGRQNRRVNLHLA